MPIIGKGDIASILNDRDGAVFFAAGVSNSLISDEKEYQREIDLLKSQPVSKCLFYFSSIGIYHRNERYFQHKKAMEATIKKYFQNYNIIRIGNIDWGKNPNTFLNYLRNKIKNNEPFEIKDEYRFMISKEQLLLLTDNLPITGKNEINAFGTMKKVKDLI